MRTVIGMGFEYVLIYIFCVCGMWGMGVEKMREVGDLFIVEVFVGV